MEKIKKLLALLRSNGLQNVSHQLKRKIFSPRRLNDYKEIISYFTDKQGLEIGGPSPFFTKNGPLPLYQWITKLDGLNYAKTTLWTGNIDKDEGYRINNRRYGEQYILDATNLAGIEKRKYDFVLSCNNLEHIANPLHAIEQWLEILKPDGLILIVVPRKESNFDHNRITIQFEHLLEDYSNNIQENDLTHLDEILELHDLKLDPWAGTKENFRERSLKNNEFRSLHHHVFDMSVLVNVFSYFNISIIKTVTIYTDHVILGKKKETLVRGNY